MPGIPGDLPAEAASLLWGGLFWCREIPEHDEKVTGKGVLQGKRPGGIFQPGSAERIALN